MKTKDTPLNAVLVGIQLPKVPSQELEGSLAELARLVTTLGYKVVGQVTQKRSSEKGATVLGDGKLQELAEWTGGTGKVAANFERKKSKAQLKWEKDETGEDEDSDPSESSEEDDGVTGPSILSSEQKGTAQIVIVDCDLSPSQLRNLESATGVSVLDRTGVIIEIFSRHARTKAARLQVEIARLAYVAPRLRETGGGEDRGGGGTGAKGAGETSLELDKRKIRDRIKELKTELASIANEHQVRRNRREQEISVALVGYTNAGKSSLMRAMTGSDVLIADKLFATLDTTVRPLYPETKPKILLSDTVGFIKKLPHDLVASFKSTLDEANNAELLIFLVDSSDPAFRSQLEVTQAVLAEVGATEAPRLLVLNKRDRLSPEENQKLKTEFPDALQISTRDPADLKMLRDKIVSFFEQDMVDELVMVPYTAKGVIGDIRSSFRVLEETYNETGTVFKIRAPMDRIEALRKKIDSSVIRPSQT